MESVYPLKIQRPALSDVVIRQRLFRLIDQQSAIKVYWISGPGGAGKTTLINSFLAEQNVPNIWYQVDESDNDLASFFFYLGLAGSKSAPDHKPSFPNFTPEYIFGLPEFSRNFFDKLFQIHQPDTYLVLDNCHEIPDDSDLYQAILYGMSRMGAGSRIIFISRNEIPIAFNRLRVNNELGLIGWHDLRLTIEELEAFSRLKALEFESSQLQQLHQLLDGWVAGFQIMAGAGQIENHLDSTFKTALFEDSQEIIFDYFAEEIFRHLESTSQEILLKSSLLPYLDTSMLRALWASTNAATIIKELCRTNIFISKQDGLPGVYNYHQLFKEFLRKRCQQSYSKDETRAVLLGAAKLFANQGKIEEAVALHIQASNWQDVIALIIQHGRALLEQGRFRTLAGWLHHIPKEIANNDPWLLYWTALCLMLQDPHKAQKIFDHALKVFREQENVVGIYLALGGMGESLAYRFDSFVPYDHWISTLETLLEQYPYFPTIEIEARITLSMMSAIALRQPAYLHADEWRSRAVSIMNNHDLDDSIRIHLLNTLILERTLTGNLTEAELLIISFKNLIERHEVPPLVLVTLKNFESLYNWRSGNSAESQKAAAAGLEMAWHSGLQVISFVLLANGAVGALIGGDLEKTDLYLNQLESQLDNAGYYTKLIYHITKTWRYLTDDQWAEALAQSKHALQLADVVGNPETSAISHLAHSLALRANAEPEGADTELEKAITICVSNPLHQIAFGCHMTKVEQLFASGNHKDGVEELQTALDIGSRMGYTMFPMWSKETASNLCVKALEHGIHKDYIHRLIKKQNLFPPRPPVDLETWPWHVKIYCLGQFKIIIEQEVLSFKGKTQQKPLELLKALISLGGKNVSDSLLSDILWPDSDGDMQHQSFNTTLHRLRKMLQVDDILLFSSGELRLNEKKCWTDIWAFQHYFSGSDNANQSNTASASQTTMGRKAISHYQGPFLPSENEGWVMRTREKLHRQYISLIETTAKYFTNKDQWNMAVSLYERGIEAEPLLSSFYHHLMHCHSKLGNKASAFYIHDQYMKHFSTRKDQIFLEIQKLYKEINGKN